jgi:ribose transport system permease protein
MMGEVKTRPGATAPDTSLSTDDAGQGRAGIASRLGNLFLRYDAIVVLIVIVIVARLSYSDFFTLSNGSNLLSQVAPEAIVALGMTLLLISGGFDLSVGSVFGAGSVIFATTSMQMPLWLSFLVTLVVGAICGLVNGLIVTWLKVNAFIATLGTASLFMGAAFVYSHDTAVFSDTPGFTTLGNGQFLGIWTTVWVLIGAGLIFAFVLSLTAYGRSVYAVGGNLEAARMSGIRVNAVRISTFAVTALCAALGGTFVASQTGTGQAGLGGSVTLDAVTIVVIGGTSLFGGQGAMWRTGIGILIWGTVLNIFSVRAMGTASQILIQGLVLLFAVGLQSISLMRKR